MSFIYLALAILFEVGGTTCLKLSDGLTRPMASVGIFVLYSAAFAFLALALKRLEVSSVYAIWSGAGTALIAVIGVAVFDESFSAVKAASIALIIIGVVGLNLSGAAH